MIFEIPSKAGLYVTTHGTFCVVGLILYCRRSLRGFALAF